MKISFENPSQEGRVYYQDIMYKNKNIGVTIMRDINILQGVKEEFQCFVKTIELVRPCKKYEGEVVQDLERDGFYVRFKTLDNFLKYWELNNEM